jgi:endonuclease YncB( thermonuclease family)
MAHSEREKVAQINREFTALAYVYVGDIMVNAELVAQGYAPGDDNPAQREASGAILEAPAGGPPAPGRALEGHEPSASLRKLGRVAPVD